MDDNGTTGQWCTDGTAVAAEPRVQLKLTNQRRKVKVQPVDAFLEIYGRTRHLGCARLSRDLRKDDPKSWFPAPPLLPAPLLLETLNEKDRTIGSLLQIVTTRERSARFGFYEGCSRFSSGDPSLVGHGPASHACLIYELGLAS